MREVSVIGIGNTLMGDDGVGVHVAEQLDVRLEGSREGLKIVTGHMAGMSLMPAVLSAEAVIFIDAIALDEAPGTIYRFDPDEAGVTGLRSTTSHGMGIPYLITNARLQGHFPEFVVYAIHIRSIMIGPDQLSDEVSSSVTRVLDLIAEEVNQLQAKSA